MDLIPRYAGYEGSDWIVNRLHVKTPVQELYEVIPLEDINSNELISIYTETPIEEDSLSLWATYHNGRLYSNKSELRAPIETIINFCESSTDAPKGLKQKLRLITKLLKEDPNVDRANVLILLAAHGGVCNIQKEIGVSMAYSLLHDNLKADLERISLGSCIIRLLYSIRELIIEELYMDTGSFKNTHPIIHFRNKLADEIGVIPVKDDRPGWDSHYNDTHKDMYWQTKYYSTKTITRSIFYAINEKPRKISYETVINWLQQNAPDGFDSYGFLSKCFDEETGFIVENAVIYILYKNDILQPDTEDTIMRLLDSLRPPEDLDQLANAIENQLVINNPEPNGNSNEVRSD